VSDPLGTATPGGAAPDGVPMLVLEGIARRFGSVPALDGASLAVRRGTVHALLGENGE
jgi:ABC-type sugar transport system ATPase subunit